MLFSRLLQRRKAKFVSDGKGYEAKRHIGEEIQPLYLRKALKADSLNAEMPEAKRADENTGDQISGDRRQFAQFGKTGHKQPQKHCERKGKQGCHKSTRFLKNSVPSAF